MFLKKKTSVSVPTTLLEVQQRLSSTDTLSWDDWMALGHSPIWQDLNPQSRLDATTLERLDVPALMSELTAAMKGQGLDPNVSVQEHPGANPGPLLSSRWFTQLDQPLLPRVVTVRLDEWTPLHRAAQEVIIGLLIGQGVDRTHAWDALHCWGNLESRTVPHQYWTLGRWAGFKDRPEKLSLPWEIIPQPWIHAVVSSRAPHMAATVQVLLNQGDTCDDPLRGETALHTLMRHPAYNEQDRRLETLKTIDLLVTHDKTMLDALTVEDELTPLGLAIIHGNLIAAQRLIELGSDKRQTFLRNAPNSDERLSLWLLACDNVSNLCFFDQGSLLDWLLDLGFDRHEVTNKGNNALHLAVNLRSEDNELYGINLDLVGWLLDHGVDPHHRNHAGQTPLDQLQEHIDGNVLQNISDTLDAARSLLERLTLQQSGPDRSALDAKTSLVRPRL